MASRVYCSWRFWAHVIRESVLPLVPAVLLLIEVLGAETLWLVDGTTFISKKRRSPCSWPNSVGLDRGLRSLRSLLRSVGRSHHRRHHLLELLGREHGANTKLMRRSYRLRSATMLDGTRNASVFCRRY